MLSNALVFLIETLFGLFAVALLLRFYLQCVRAPYRNPLSEFLAALTDFAVRRARRIIPGLWQLDLATLILAWIVEVVQIVIVILLKDYSLSPQIGVAFIAIGAIAALRLVRLTVYIVMVAVIAQAILSWISPYHPLAPLLHSMTAPFLRRFQRIIPPIGNVDLSPLFVIIVCQLVLMLPVAWLEMSAVQLL